jgi:NAD(P)-dependent dehydrogenase (short-subunit alcohol dehydrogenase family)
VRRFVAEGARVMIADVQDLKGEQLAASLGGAALYQRTDVTREEDVRAAVQRAVEAYGRLDCMFNNAGLAGPSGPIDELSLADYDYVMSVLLRGVVAGMKHAAAVMKRQRSGVILNTSSVAGVRAGYGSHVYTAAKAAVIHVTTSVAMELGESGVRVNCICPGGIATPIFKPILGNVDDEAAVETMKPYLAASQPIKRAGLAEDIANAALWLASDEASFVTGHALVVDGGLTGGRQWSEITQALTQSEERSGL